MRHCSVFFTYENEPFPSPNSSPCQASSAFSPVLSFYSGRRERRRDGAVLRYSPNDQKVYFRLPCFRLWPGVRFSDLHMCRIADGDFEYLASCFDNAGRGTLRQV